MPHRSLVSRQLGTLLGLLSNPARLHIVEELGRGERDVAALQAVLGISQSGVSQHLSLLRAHGVVLERREGRHVHYRLHRPELSAWLLGGLAFITPDVDEVKEVQAAVRRARATWGSR